MTNAGLCNPHLHVHPVVVLYFDLEGIGLGRAQGIDAAQHLALLIHPHLDLQQGTGERGQQKGVEEKRLWHSLCCHLASINSSPRELQGPPHAQAHTRWLDTFASCYSAPRYTWYNEFSMRSPRSTSPKFSADWTIFSGRQYGRL